MRVVERVLMPRAVSMTEAPSLEGEGRLVLRAKTRALYAFPRREGGLPDYIVRPKAIQYPWGPSRRERIEFSVNIVQWHSQYRKMVVPEILHCVVFSQKLVHSRRCYNEEALGPQKCL